MTYVIVYMNTPMAKPIYFQVLEKHSLWQHIFPAYPSLKHLGSWARDLRARVEHFANWAETLRPPLFFWLAAYTFPTGFLTAVLQVQFS